MTCPSGTQQGTMEHPQADGRTRATSQAIRRGGAVPNTTPSGLTTVAHSLLEQVLTTQP